MGILNVTPDSYFIKFPDIDAAINHGKRLHAEGADIIDIGGESTRPGAAIVPEQDELDRVIPVIKALSSTIPIQISIDTSKPKVAELAVAAGATLINDVTGFRDPAMQEIAASSNIDLCIMHMQGTPRSMQTNPQYPDGVVSHIMAWLDHQINQLIKRGVKESQIIIDPGIGFGKTVDHNLEILQNLPKIKTMGFPLLLGVSRKSFMTKILNLSTQDLLSATVAVNTVLIRAKTVDIIRVHDVGEHRSIINILKHL